MSSHAQVATNGSPTHTAVPALDRALALLQTLAHTPKPLTLSQISDLIGVSRSTVYSLLATLQKHGMVDKDPQHKTYRLGVGALVLGNAYLDQVSLLPVFNEVAQRLVNTCRETVKLAVLDRREVVYIGKQEGLYSVRLVARIGSRMPAHATAVGKVLLAQLDEQQLDQLYLGYHFPHKTPNTISSRAMLSTMLLRVRAEGYAYDMEESALGLQCVAAPVYDHGGAVAAMSIGVPKERLSDNRLAELRTLLLDHTREISHTLGWTDRAD